MHLLATLLWLLSVAQPARAARAAECFPFEELPPPLRTKAEALLLQALDSEALYTLAGGLKPVSSGLSLFRVKVADPDLAEVEAIRQILRTWRCGDEIAAGVQHFAAVRDGVRALDIFVVHRPSLATLLEDRRAFFAPYGLSPSADPMEVILAVEYDPTPARFRGWPGRLRAIARARTGGGAGASPDARGDVSCATLSSPCVTNRGART